MRPPRNFAGCRVPPLVADRDRYRAVRLEAFAQPLQGGLRLVLLGHQPLAEIAVFDASAHRVEIADAEARGGEAMDRAAEMTDREPKAAPGDFGDEVVEAEIAGPEDDPAPLVQCRRDLFGTKDVDLRLPAVRAPGAQILEAFLVAIGPVFGGKATRACWRRPGRTDLTSAVSLRFRSGCVAALTLPNSRDSGHHADSGKVQASIPCTAKRGTS